MADMEYAKDLILMGAERCVVRICARMELCAMRDCVP